MDITISAKGLEVDFSSVDYLQVTLRGVDVLDLIIGCGGDKIPDVIGEDRIKDYFGIED